MIALRIVCAIMRELKVVFVASVFCHTFLVKDSQESVLAAERAALLIFAATQPVSFPAFKIYFIHSFATDVIGTIT